MSPFRPRALAPVVRARSLLWLRHTRRDLAGAVTYYQEFGLTVAHATEGQVFLRASGRDPACLVLEQGTRDAFAGLAFSVGSEGDLEALAAARGGEVVARTEPGGGKVLRLVDPSGLAVEAVHGVAGLPALPGRPPVPLNTPSEKRRLNAPRPAVLAPAEVHRLGHLVLGRQEFARNATWYVETFGLIASDLEVVPGLNEPIVAFMRLDRGAEPTDHHTLVVAAAPEDGYLHAAFEVADVEALGSCAEWLQTRGREKLWGIGRHVLGSQLFCYHRDECGLQVEQYTDGDVYDAAAPTRTHEGGLAGLYLWGPLLPAGFVDTSLNASRLGKVLAGLRTRTEMTLARLLAVKELYSHPPRPWANRRLPLRAPEKGARA